MEHSDDARATRSRERDRRATAIHDALGGVRPLMTGVEIAQCVLQLEAGLEGASEDLLCEIGQVERSDLDRAREESRRARSDLEHVGRALPARIRALARDPATAAWLWTVVAGGAPDERSSTRAALVLHGRSYTLEIPRTRDCVDNVVQVFLLEQYRHDPSGVSRIYDLGAFIGLSSIYLSSVDPRAEVIAVEPCPSNLAVLRRNLESQPALRASVVPAAVGTRTGSTVLRAPLSVGWGASSKGLVTDPEFRSLDVDSIDLAALVAPGEYGIKLDIEGAEFDLRERAGVLERARWILGELHFGPWSRPEDRWLRELLAARFDLVLSAPVVVEDGDGFWVSQDFAARPRG